MLVCPFHWITGYDCPFCGTQRMLWAAVHGQWAEAFAYNPFVACLLPVALVLGVAALLNKGIRRRMREAYSDKWLLLALLVLLIWGVLRNFAGL